MQDDTMATVDTAGTLQAGRILQIDQRARCHERDVTMFSSGPGVPRTMLT